MDTAEHTAARYDTLLFTKREFCSEYKELPDHGTPMVGRPYIAADDWCIQVGLLLMLIMLVVAFRRCQPALGGRIKEFFSSGRFYMSGVSYVNASLSYDFFVMKVVSVASLSLMFFDMLARRLEFSAVLGIPYWVVCAAMVVLFAAFSLRSAIYSLVNWTFLTAEQQLVWSRSFSLLNALSALALYPLALMYLFGSVSGLFVILLASFVFIFYEILLVYKLFANFLNKNSEYLLIILYLCAVEILPALVLWHVHDWVIDKFIVNNILY